MATVTTPAAPTSAVTVKVGSAIPWIIVAVLLILTALISHCSYSARLNSEQAVVTQSLANLSKVSAAAVKDSLGRVVAERRADSLASSASRSDSIARIALHEATTARTAYATLAARAPSACDTTTAAADTAFKADDAALSHLVDERDSLKRSNLLYKGALDSTVVDLRAVLAAGHSVSTAVHTEQKAEKESLLSRLAPHFGIGAAGGISVVTGKPDATVGLTLGWKF